MSTSTKMISSTGKLFEGFLGNCIKKGFMPDQALCLANAKLKLKYQVDNPIQVAIDAVKPVIRHPAKKGFSSVSSQLPEILTPIQQSRMAVKWILEGVRNRKYAYDCRNFEKGVFDEVSAIFDGTSSIFQKRFNYHKGM